MLNIREKIIKLTKEVIPYENFDENTELINDGILSSLEIFVLIQSIETDFNIFIPEENVIPENFSSIISIEKMINNIINNNEL